MGSYTTIAYQSFCIAMSIVEAESEAEAPKIEFPCEGYPVKIIGISDPGYRETVLNILLRHAPDFDATRMEITKSRKGNYESMTVWITATGPEQLSALNQDLRTSALVKLVL